MDHHQRAVVTGVDGSRFSPGAGAMEKEGTGADRFEVTGAVILFPASCANEGLLSGQTAVTADTKGRIHKIEERLPAFRQHVPQGEHTPL